MNIFDIAGGSKSPKRKGPAEKKKSEKEAPPGPENVKKQSKDEDVQQMFQQMKQWRDTLADQLEQSYQQSALAKEKIDQVVKLMRDRSMTNLEEREEKLQEKIYKVLGQESKSQAKKAKEVKDTKKRKRKSVGGRKGWISMQ